MRAVWMRTRVEIRTRWRAWVALSVLIGVFGGTALAAVAGAQRTDSVVDRAIATQRPADIYMVPAFQENGDLLAFDRIRAFPEVVDAVDIHGVFAQASVGDLDVSVLPEPLLDPSRVRVLEGSLPDRNDEKTAAVNFLARDAFGLHEGSRVTMRFAGPGGDPNSEREPPLGPEMIFRITGVISTLGDFAGGAQPGIYLSPAFERAHADSISTLDIFAFTLRHGPDDYAAFRAHTSELTGGVAVLAVEARSGNEQAKRSFHVYAVALWILGGFLALTGAMVLGQTLARLTALESVENPSLRALGLSAAQLIALGALRVSLIAGAGAAIASVVMVALSPLMPFGRPGLAEPRPGVDLAWGTLIIGLVALIVVPLAITAVPVWRSRKVEDRARARRSPIVGWVTRAFSRPAPAIGVRLALEPGHGPTAVPVRTSISSAALGIVAIIIALTAGASLDHLVNTPRLYGWNWDASVGSSGGDFASGSADARKLAAIPGVEAFTGGVSGEGGLIEIRGRVTSAMALNLDGPSPVAPPVLEGTYPRAAGEVVVGRRTLLSAHTRIGDVVDLTILGTSLSKPFKIVGVAVLPFSDDATALGEGILLSMEGIRSFDPKIPEETAIVRFTPGADRSKVLQALRTAFGNDQVETPSRPTTIVDFGHVNALPLIVAGIVGLLAAGTIIHVLVSAIRRRRRDLAILMTLGFVRAQVRSAVAWQATTLAVGALIIGVPLGLVAGRWLWVTFAHVSGFPGEVVVHPAGIALIAAGALILANLIALLPARAAARTQPAIVLRSE